MGLTDKLKDLKSKAEDAVVERGDQIHSAVEKATSVADERTGGKYRERIQKAGAKADGLVESLKDTNARGSDAETTAGGADADAGAHGADAETTAGGADAQEPGGQTDARASADGDGETTSV